MHSYAHRVLLANTNGVLAAQAVSIAWPGDHSKAQPLFPVLSAPKGSISRCRQKLRATAVFLARPAIAAPFRRAVAICAVVAVSVQVVVSVSHVKGAFGAVQVQQVVPRVSSSLSPAHWANTGSTVLQVA
jgi:hypothetical protein